MDQKIIEDIKYCLFSYLEGSSSCIESQMSKDRFDVVINDVVKSCYDEAVSIGGNGDDNVAAAATKAASISVLATGLLHYLLTASLITSQRKIDYNDCAVDIIVPDIKTLKNDPKKALLLCIPDTADAKAVNESISRLEKIQPHMENIWLVLSKDVPTSKRTYVLAKEGNTFAEIIFDISKFVRVNESSKFKILKI